MNKKFLHTTAILLLLSVLLTMLCGCGRKSSAAEAVSPVSNQASASANEPGDLSEPQTETADTLTEDQALSAIMNYCCTLNPDLESIVKSGEYPAYWEISSGDESQIVVLFRSYTGALCRYYIDRTTGDTYVTEFVPGITDEEQRTEESQKELIKNV